MTSTNSERPLGSTTIALNNGSKIPVLGLGAMEYGLFFPESDKPRVRESITQIIKAGCRLIDTSKVYATEELIGDAIRASGVPRSEITVVTKLPNECHHDPHAAFHESLRKLDTGYIDIYIMHWPCAYTPDGKRPLSIEESPTFIETYKMMESLVGPECRSLGVSNFTQKTLDALLQEAKIKPVVNQIEVHPLNPNLKLIPYCQERQIQVMAWGPLAGGPKSLYMDSSGIYNSTTLTSLALHYNVSVGVVILSWLTQRGVIVIPHMSSPTRMAENLHLVTFTDEEMQEINSMHEKIGRRRLIDSVEMVWFDNLIPGKGRTIHGWTVQEMGWEDEQGNSLT